MRTYTPKEIGGLWGCSTKTVLRLVGKGELPALRLSRKTILITSTDAAATYAVKFSGLSSIGSIENRGGRPWGTRVSA